MPPFKNIRHIPFHLPTSRLLPTCPATLCILPSRLSSPSFSIIVFFFTLRVHPRTHSNGEKEKEREKEGKEREMETRRSAAFNDLRRKSILERRSIASSYTKVRDFQQSKIPARRIHSHTQIPFSRSTR